MKPRREHPPGYTTTEFWLALAALVLATVLRFVDRIDADAWMTVTTGATAGYAISRGLAKRGTNA